MSIAVHKVTVKVGVGIESVVQRSKGFQAMNQVQFEKKPEDNAIILWVWAANADEAKEKITRMFTDSWELPMGNP